MGEASRGNGAGHAPDGAGGFVLSEDAAALFADDAAAIEAVRAHAGEHDGENAGAVDFGCGAKQYIDGGAAVVFKRALGEAQRGRR